MTSHIQNMFLVQEHGCNFTLASGSVSFCGTVAVVSADNPASNALGGFKESASATRHCRQCLGTCTEAQQEVHH